MADEREELEAELRRISAQRSSEKPLYRHRHSLSIACYHMIRTMALADRVPPDSMRMILDTLIERAQAVKDDLPIDT